jgi:two-component system nitrogen regulation response regulator NtrX
MQPHKEESLNERQENRGPRPNPYILVVDDEPDIRNLLQEILEDEGYDVSVAEDGESARKSHRDRRPDLVLLDIWMPDVDGITLLKEWAEEGGGLPMPVIMMSGHGTVETAVEATRLGAYDFIEKPLSLAKLLLTIEHALETERLQRENQGLRRQSHMPHEPVGHSAVLQRLREQVKRIAEHDTWVLMTGESGSGMNVVAHYLHNCSPHRERPFVEVSIASLAAEGIEAQLFGSEDEGKIHYGLLEQANGGTLFISDVGDLDMATQTRLNSALETRAFQRVGGDTSVQLYVRIIAATHYNLETMIEQEKFRKDLYYQLNVVPLRIPSLREHREDVPELLNYYVNLYVEQDKLPYRKFSLPAQNRLRNYHWPGNIRELSNLVQRLLIIGAGTEISLDEVEQALGASSQPISGSIPMGYDRPLREAREQFEKAYLEYQLKQHEGSVGKVAKIVGLERTHLYRKLRSLGIDPKSLGDKD